MSSTVLPSLPPLAADYVVAVCAACKLRFCLLECKRCDARKKGDPGEAFNYAAGGYCDGYTALDAYERAVKEGS